MQTSAGIVIWWS